MATLGTYRFAERRRRRRGGGVVGNGGGGLVSGNVTGLQDCPRAGSGRLCRVSECALPATIRAIPRVGAPGPPDQLAAMITGTPRLVEYPDKRCPISPVRSPTRRRAKTLVCSSAPEWAAAHIANRTVSRRSPVVHGADLVTALRTAYKEKRKSYQSFVDKVRLAASPL
jgi:hypothetical protein